MHRAVAAVSARLSTASRLRALSMMSSIQQLRTPAYVCYRDVMERNIEKMTTRAESLGCVLRPHIKTTKTLEGAALLTGGTKRRCVVSTLAEATFLADGGFDDILYAVPLTPDKVGAAAELTARLEAFHVMVDSMASVKALAAASCTKPFSVVVMVDCGYHRDGVDPDDPESIELVRALSSGANTRFAGVRVPCGPHLSPSIAPPAPSQRGCLNHSAHAVLTGTRTAATRTMRRTQRRWWRWPRRSAM